MKETPWVKCPRCGATMWLHAAAACRCGWRLRETKARLAREGTG